jgi:hypothetical protein
LQEEAMKTSGKYARTLHSPWSEHVTTDDKKWTQKQIDEQFIGQDTVLSAKLDGECTTLRSDIYHARAVDSRYHPSRKRIRDLHKLVKKDIPLGWRICGENILVRHSIKYSGITSTSTELPKGLTAYFRVFTIFNEKGVALSWDETVWWCDLLDLQTVPVLWRGTWDEKKVKEFKSASPVFGGKDVVTGEPALEGYVFRLAGEIQVGQVEDSNENSREILLGVGKYVRKDHIKTDDHWMHSEMVYNELDPEINDYY